MLYGMDLNLISEVDCYRIHVAYRKLFCYIFKLPLWTHLSELLGIFNIEQINVLLNNKYTDFLRASRPMCNRFDELKFICHNNVRNLIM